MYYGGLYRYQYEVKIVLASQKQLNIPCAAHQMSFFSHWGSISNCGSVATATAAASSSSASLPSNHPLQEMLNRQQMTAAAAATAAASEPRFNWAKGRAATSATPFFQLRTYYLHYFISDY